MPDASVNGHRLHYLDEGQGPPLVLAHGNAGSAEVWRKVIPALAREHRVIAHDRRGFGRSDLPAPDETRDPAGFGPHAYARELCALLDVLDIERAHVAGLSFGGMVAQCLALDAPERVGRLLLVGTTADRTGRDVTATLAELARDGWSAVAARLVASWFRPDSDPADIDEAHTIAMRSPQHLRAVTVQALGSFDIRAELPRIRVPTLVVVGADDRTCPLPFAQTLAAGIPDAELAVIEQCAHLVPVEQPQRFAELALAFLREPVRP